MNYLISQQSIDSISSNASHYYTKFFENFSAASDRGKIGFYKRYFYNPACALLFAAERHPGKLITATVLIATGTLIYTFSSNESSKGRNSKLSKSIRKLSRIALMALGFILAVATAPAMIKRIVSGMFTKEFLGISVGLATLVYLSKDKEREAFFDWFG